MGEQEVTMSIGFGSQAGLALVIGVITVGGLTLAIGIFALAYRLVVNARKKVVD